MSYLSHLTQLFSKKPAHKDHSIYLYIEKWITYGKEYSFVEKCELCDHIVHIKMLIADQSTSQSTSKLKKETSHLAMQPCTKYQYTKKEAQTQLNKQQKNKRLPRIPTAIYACPKCHFWHITSKK